MSRINVVDRKTATDEAKELLDGVQQQLGIVPNFIRALANSPKALSAFLGLYGPLGGAAVVQGDAGAHRAGRGRGERLPVVALNVFTNLLGKSTLINIDFPEVALLASAEKAAA